MKAQRRSIALLFLESRRWLGWVANTTPQRLYPRQRGSVPIVQEDGWSPGQRLDVCGKSGPLTGFDAQNFQAVASHYTYCVIPALQKKNCICLYYLYVECAVIKLINYVAI